MAYIETMDNDGIFNGDNGDVDDYIGVVGNNNTLNGGAGEDVLEVYGNDNRLNGGDDNDTLGASGNNNVLNGGPGEDTLVSVDGNNTLNGDADNDELFGMDGKDILNGGPGDDSLEGGGAADTFKFSFTLDQEPGEAKTFQFTDWLSEKYGKDFGDELPDFERGHHHHGHHHGWHHHHHQHGGCDDHQPQQWGLSQSFFSKNYSDWLREVVVPDLEAHLQAEGLTLDTNDNGRIGVRLNQHDPDGTPRIEGLTKDQLSAIFSDRDEVTLRHGHHGHDAWYSNSYTSPSSGGETKVASEDGFDTIHDFAWGEDMLELNGLAGLTLDDFTNLFKATETDTDNDGVFDDTTLALADDSWSVTLENVTGHTVTEFYTDAVLLS